MITAEQDLDRPTSAVRAMTGEVVAGRPAHRVRNSEFSVQGAVGPLVDHVQPALDQLVDLRHRDSDTDGVQLEITRDLLTGAQP